MLYILFWDYEAIPAYQRILYIKIYASIKNYQIHHQP